VADGSGFRHNFSNTGRQCWFLIPSPRLTESTGKSNKAELSGDCVFPGEPFVAPCRATVYDGIDGELAICIPGQPKSQRLETDGREMSVSSGTKSESGIGETIRVVIHALIIALVIRTFLFQPFNIPSGSMKATLLVGDYLFVSKYSYGYSHYSLPLSPPLFSGRVFGSSPSRGDIVVFRLPKDDSTDYIKRVIGLPGDTIEMRGGILHINGKAVARERLPDYVGEDPCGSDSSTPVKRWKETLPEGVTYETLDCTDVGFYDNTPPYKVPEGHYFMMGDNRDNSTDSRVLSAVGYVPFENLIGRAQLIFFSIAEGERAWQVWRWPFAVRWHRLFTIVR
jgi:signal peptidase I